MAIKWSLRNKTPQQQIIIAAKNRDSGEVKRYSNTKSAINDLDYSISIFMKLGWDSTGKFDGYNTIKKYKNCIIEHGAAWFSTNALKSGMAKKQLENFLAAINNGKRVFIYFVIGKSGGGTNKIEFRAEVLDLVSVRGGIRTPDINITPELWNNEISSIWIKINKLNKCNTKKVEDFKFVSNEKNLSQALHSNCCFGYITEV